MAREGASALGLWMLLASLPALAGCNGAPTAPDPDPVSRYPPATLILQQTGDTFENRTSAFRAWGAWVAGASDRWLELTSDATWESRSPDVIAVVGPGRIAGLAPGDAELRISYRGTTATPLLRVFAGEPPFWVVRPDEWRTVGCSVRDATVALGSGGAIAGAHVDILAGHNAGRSAVTDNGGLYRFDTPFVCGPATIRASKSGYRDVTESSFLCPPSSFPCFAMAPL